MTHGNDQRISTERLQELWERYHQTGDQTIRERLVLSLAPMVKYIAYRKVREVPTRCDVEDFVSCGLEALMRSIDRYDPSRGATLEQFAWTRIHGAVIDELRRNDWAPRSLRRCERDISSAREAFVTLQGREPTHTELSSALAMSELELDRHLGDIQRSEVGSLDVIVTGEDETAITRVDTVASSDRSLDPEQATMLGQAKARVREAFDGLSAREQQVAVLLYVDNLTLREIGDSLGVTESRVCQIHAQLRRRLREVLAPHDTLLTEVA